MVGRKKKTRRSKTSLGNHQRGWLWGKHAVLETLRAGRWVPFEVNLCSELVDGQTLDEVQSLCERSQIEVKMLDQDDLQRVVNARDHQGLSAQMPEFPFATFDELIDQLPENPFLLILDRIQDPYNFGSILRSADLFGVDGVIISNREQAGVSSHVARSSVGAVNYLNICQMESLPDAAQRLKTAGIRLIAAFEKGDRSPAEMNMQQNLALVLGNEGAGIGQTLLEQCDDKCAIPQTGHVDSLNAAVAAGILCYEVHRQRNGS
jgi:23S rRNA (guanosine2251-2'-O)-methyltransferase